MRVGRRRVEKWWAVLGSDWPQPGRLLVTLIAGIAQFERELMLERQRAGIAKAKAAGKYRGRAPTARAKAAQVLALKAEGVGPSEIARRLGIGRSSVYRLLGSAA